MSTVWGKMIKEEKKRREGEKISRKKEENGKIEKRKQKRMGEISKWEDK